MALPAAASVFLPHDAMLERVLAMALCPSVSVCLSVSVTSRSSIQTAEQIELFSMDTYFGLTYTVL